MRILWSLLLLVAIQTTSGCSLFQTRTRVDESVDLKALLSPMNQDALRQKAIDGAAQNLESLPSPNLAAGLFLPELEEIFQNDLKNAGVVKLDITGDAQLVRVKLRFKRQFTNRDFKPDSAAAKFLVDLNPEVDAQFIFHAGIDTATGQDGKGNPVLYLRLLPSLTDIKANRIRVKGKIELKSIANPILDLLLQQRDLFTSILVKSSIAAIPIPAQHKIELDDIKKLGKSVFPRGVVLEHKTVVADIRVPTVAWLVDEDRLSVMTQVLINNPSPGQAPRVGRTMEDVSDRFEGLLDESFQLPENEETAWLAIRKDLLAGAVNSAVNQAQMCASSPNLTQTLKLDSKIPLPDGSDMSCKVNFDCPSARQCKYEASRDERNCYRCLVPSPRICTRFFGRKECVGGGGCLTKGQDPVCVSARTAQNAIYDADANLRKANCDVARETEIGQCKVAANAGKALCDGARETLQAMKRTGQGDLGRIEASAKIDAGDLRVCLPKLDVSKDLDKVTARIEITGKANVDAHMKFTPLDIVGHIACQFPWTNSEQFTVATAGAISPTLLADYKMIPGGVSVSLQAQPLSVLLKVDPSPLAMLVKNKNMLLACNKQLLSFTVPLLPFLAPMRGDIDYELPTETMAFPIKFDPLEVGGRKIEITPHVTRDAFIVQGALIRRD